MNQELTGLMNEGLNQDFRIKKIKMSTMYVEKCNGPLLKELIGNEIDQLTAE